MRVSGAGIVDGVRVASVRADGVRVIGNSIEASGICRRRTSCASRKISTVRAGPVDSVHGRSMCSADARSATVRVRARGGHRVGMSCEFGLGKCHRDGSSCRSERMRAIDSHGEPTTKIRNIESGGAVAAAVSYPDPGKQDRIASARNGSPVADHVPGRCRCPSEWEDGTNGREILVHEYRRNAVRKRHITPPRRGRLCRASRWNPRRCGTCRHRLRTGWDRPGISSRRSPSS